MLLPVHVGLNFERGYVQEFVKILQQIKTGVAKLSQRSNAKIDVTSGFWRLELFWEFDSNVGKNFEGKRLIKKWHGERKFHVGKLRRSIIKFPMHTQRINLNFRKFKRFVWSSFGGNCTRARRLTSVWAKLEGSNVKILYPCLYLAYKAAQLKSRGFHEINVSAFCSNRRWL